MIVNFSYKKEFSDLIESIRNTYGEKILELEGIGSSQLDINQNAKQFLLNTTTTADISIDANANVDNKDITGYQFEVVKPIFKLNSVYLLWEKLYKSHGLEYANDIITKQVIGDIYINDFGDVGKPYSYHPHTLILTHSGLFTMENLFMCYEEMICENGDMEIIDCQYLGLKVFDGKDFVKITKLIRHISHTDLIAVVSNQGRSVIITEDHPFITPECLDGKQSKELTLSDKIISTDRITEEFKNTTLQNTSSLKYLGVNIDANGHIDNDEVIIQTLQFERLQRLCVTIEALEFIDIKVFISNKNDEILYNISFKIPFDKHQNILEYSKKLKENQNIFKKFDIEIESSGKIEQLLKIPYKGKFVYDITTETGRFASNGVFCHNCFNYSMYDVCLFGLPMIKKITSVPPKTLFAFKSQVEQFVIHASNSTLGASGLADYLICMAWYVDKIEKNNFSDGKIKLYPSKEAVDTYVKENLISFIYTINQPLRSSQSPFTNVSIYDEYFLDELIKSYVFIDGTTPKKETVKRVQELYIDAMNEEQKRTPITFPVEKIAA